MKKLGFIFTAAAALVTLGLPAAWGSWQNLDGALNDNSAFDTSMSVHGGVPFVALSDPDGSGNGGIHVKSFDGMTWNDVDTNPINTTGEYESANAPSLAVDGDGNLYVAWQQDHNDVPVTRQVFVKWHDGTGWADLGANPLNENPSTAASAPRIVVDASGHVYAAWHEDDGTGVTQLFVKRHNGTDWELVGANPINEDPAHSARLASVALDPGGNPLVAWQEEDGSVPPVTQIFVKSFNGASWDLVGTDNPLNVSPNQNAYSPRIAFNGAVPYLTWKEQSAAHDLKTQVYVQRYDEAVDLWDFVGDNDSLNISADRSAHDPAIAFDEDGNPFVAWYEGTAAFEDVVFAKKFNGTAWGLVARLNLGDGYLAEMPSIVFDDTDGLPYLNWLEEDAANDFKVYVAKSTPTFTSMKSLAATPCASEICINVAWETDMEPENAGFHVWRLTDLPGQEYVQITASLIPAEGTESTGAAYGLVDSDVVSGQSYFYEVEDIGVAAGSTLHGPVSAVAPIDTPTPWEAASTVKDPAGASGPYNILGLVLIPLAALWLLAVLSLRKKARQPV